MKVLKASNDILPLEELPFRHALVSSRKFDGNRGMCIAGDLFSSSMKEPRNARLKLFLQPLIDYCRSYRMVVDYELYCPCKEEIAHHAELSGCINSINDPLPSELRAFIFDACSLDDFGNECRHTPYRKRIPVYHDIVDILNCSSLVAVEQTPVANAAEAALQFKQALDDGDEGVMIRSLDIWTEGSRLRGGFYKHGRATNGESIIWKQKNYVTLDGRIIDVVQRRMMKPDWPREYTKEGYLKRPLEKDAYTVTDMVGTFVVEVELEEGAATRTVQTELSFGPGWDLDKRRKLWYDYIALPSSLLGRHVEFTHMPHGAMEGGALRVGKLIRFRPDLDGEESRG